MDSRCAERVVTEVTTIMVSSLGAGVWCMVRGAPWCLVYGVWRMVPGVQPRAQGNHSHPVMDPIMPHNTLLFLQMETLPRKGA